MSPAAALAELRDGLPHPDLLRFDVVGLVPLGLQPDRNLSRARLRVLVSAAADPPPDAGDSTVVDALHAIQLQGNRPVASPDALWWQLFGRSPQAAFVVDLDVAAPMALRDVPLVRHPLEADLSHLARAVPPVRSDQKE